MLRYENNVSGQQLEKITPEKKKHISDTQTAFTRQEGFVFSCNVRNFNPVVLKTYHGCQIKMEEFQSNRKEKRHQVNG